MNTAHRKPLPGTPLDHFDARAAVNALRPGAWDGLPYVSRVLAEQLVRRCDPALLDDALRQLVERRRDRDFPWYPARVVCHDILGQTALVDLAGLRDAIAEQGGDPAKVNPVVPTQLIVDHSLAVEYGGDDPQAFEKNRAVEDRRNEDRFHFIDWTKRAFENVDVIPAGNGIMHQINLETMSPVIQFRDGVAFPDTCVGHRQPHPARRRPGRHRHRRRRARGRNGDARPRLDDAAAGHCRRPPDRRAPARHHRDRHRAGPHRVPA
ncbi:protein of unknown function (plasmid) [Azospirillum baldaniorum]|uniref:aconitate hydratase n=1 Tax=Azospirillum baldaniorum TaxID=1064539 RepID=A0A9P1NQS6_9PROT|nr:protein of unknown function [Azospirillum baldaniorum]